MTQDPARRRSQSKGRAGDSFTPAERRFLRLIGLTLNKHLHDQGKKVESLALELGVARSTLREIIAGRSNFRILTFSAIAKGLGFRNIAEFLRASER